MAQSNQASNQASLKKINYAEKSVEEIAPFLGYYENFLYGPPEKNHYHYVTISQDTQKNQDAFIWKTECNQWTLTPLDKKLEFAVGDTCPYHKNGYTVMKLKADYKGNIIGAYGPGNEYFTKVERHSEIKYNLKNVKRATSADELKNDEDEGDSHSTTKGDHDDAMKYDKAFGFEWKGGKCTRSKCIGRVNIDQNFVISLSLVVHGKTCSEWENILHVGCDNKERSPGIWLHPKSYKLHVRLSDAENWNTGYDPNGSLEQNKLYKIKLQCIDNQVSLFINDKLEKFSANVIHATRWKAPVFVSDPWYQSANATISDLKIYSTIK